MTGSVSFMTSSAPARNTNAETGHGLLRIGGSLVPFANVIPKDTELYKLMSTTPGE